MCTNSYVLERIERYFKMLRSYKKDVERSVSDLEKKGKIDRGRLEKYLELFSDPELDKVLDYIGIFKIDPKKEILDPLKESLDLMKRFLESGDLSIGRKLIETTRRINV